MDTIINLTLS